MHRKNNKVKIVVLFNGESVFIGKLYEIIKLNGINIKKATIYIDYETGLSIVHDGDPLLSSYYYDTIYDELYKLQLEELSKLKLNLNINEIEFDILIINFDNIGE